MHGEPALTPALALDYLDELSTDIRAAVVLDASGTVAASSVDGAEEERMGQLVRELFERAEAAAADGEAVSQVEAWTVGGGVFAARDATWTIAVVTGRYALSSLMFYDLRAVISDLGGGGAAGRVREP
jgi:hypothetical protein